MAETVTFSVDLRLDLELFTKQRAAVLAAYVAEAAVGDGVRDALDGIINLLDHVSDEAQGQGLMTDGERRQWWAEGCIAYGLGDPREDECDHPGGFRTEDGRWHCSNCPRVFASHEAWGEETGNMGAVRAVEAAIEADLAEQETKT